MHKLYAVAAGAIDDLRTLDAEILAKLADPKAETELKASGYWDDDDDSDEGYLYLGNGMAVVQIEGTMVSSSNWYTRYAKIPAYDSLCHTFAKLKADARVEKVLVKADTPGGHVAGISEFITAWSALNAVKPITVHTTKVLASAGIWAMADSSGGIYASETALVGSIGVYQVHSSKEGMRKEQRIEDTIFKSTHLKAIGNPYKDLTEEDKVAMQQSINEAAELFTTHVASTIPNLNPAVYSGETFGAKRAASYNLIAGVQSWDQTFKQLSESGSETQGGSGMKKTYMTQAMAEAAVGVGGVDPATIKIVADEKYKELLASGEVTAPSAGEPTEPNEPEANGEVTTDEQILALTAQLTESTATAEALQAKVIELETRLEASASDPLRKIAEDRINAMRIPLGLSALDFTAHSVETLLVDYNSTEAQFSKSFKPGGHFSKAPDADQDKEKGKVKNVGVNRRTATAISLMPA